MTKAELEAQNEELIGFLISLRDAIDDKLDELSDDEDDEEGACIPAGGD